MRIFLRLLGFLRPYTRAVAWSFALAFGAIGATVLIPFLTGQAINSISSHSKHDLVMWSLAIVAAGLGRLGLSVARRLVAGQVSLGVEVDLRNGLYGQLQRVGLSVFDPCPDRAPISRA